MRLYNQINYIKQVYIMDHTENSSNSSGGEVILETPPQPSKKQVSPAFRWCFTLNNWTKSEHSSIVKICEENCRKFIIGEEIGEYGTPHLQGFIRFKQKKRPMGLFENKRIHWESTSKYSTDKQNFEYCTKEDKNYLSKGFPKPLKLINPSYWWQQDILKLIKEEPDNRTIHWYWSKEGKMGKTQFCKYLSAVHNAACLHGKGSDVRNGIVEYSENNEGTLPEIVVFPIVRSYNTDYLCYESLENIKDMYFYSGKYHGGMVNGNSPHLIVFSNEPPAYEKLSVDRWKVVEIKTNHPIAL